MTRIGEFLLAAAMMTGNPIGATAEAAPNTVSSGVAKQQASSQSTMFVPDSLKNSYPSLRDTSQNSPYFKFSPGTIIFLNPSDAKGNSPDGVRNVINAALPEGSPYGEMIYVAIQNNREIRGSVLNTSVASPEAILLPGLKDAQGKQLQIIIIRSVEDYSQNSGFSAGFMGSYTRVRNKYNLGHEVNAQAIMAAVTLHELGHASDEKFAIPSAYDRSLLIAPLQAELVADCAAEKGALMKGIGDALGITPQTMQDYRDGRAISMLLRLDDTHATAIIDLNEQTCSSDFNYNSLIDKRLALNDLKEKILMRVGQHFLPDMLNAVVNGRDAIPTNIPSEQKLTLEGYAKDREKIRNFSYTLKYYKDTPFVTQLLGMRMTSGDPAIVYGVVKNMLENPEESKNLSPTQKEYIQKFMEASDRLYPDMKLSAGVGLGAMMKPYSSEARVEIIQQYMNGLPAVSQPAQGPAKPS